MSSNKLATSIRLALALICASCSAESYASHPCDEDRGDYSTTRIERFETISAGDVVNSVRERLGGPSCTDDAKFDDGFEYRTDVYYFSNGWRAEVYYIDGKAIAGYLWKPSTEVARILFGRWPHGRPTPGAIRID